MKITLCGSTRFIEAFKDWNKGLTLAGHIVYGLAMHGRQEVEQVEKPTSLEVVSDAEKIRFDLMHLAKIEESDAIVVLNVGGYIGDSTKREIAWARIRNKEIYWLQTSSNGKFLGRTVWQLYTSDGDAIATIACLGPYTAT